MALSVVHLTFHGIFTIKTSDSETEGFITICYILNLIIFFCLGILRGAINYPTGKYYSWLLETPWEKGKDLPFGTLYLKWHEVAFAMLLITLSACSFSFLSFRLGIEHRIDLSCFMMSMTFMLGLIFAWLGKRDLLDDNYSYLALMTPLIILIVSPNYVGVGLSITLGLLFSYASCRSSIADEINTKLVDVTDLKPATNPNTFSLFGWPYSHLLFEPSKRSISHKKAIKSATLTFLCLYLTTSIPTLGIDAILRAYPGSYESLEFQKVTNTIHIVMYTAIPIVVSLFISFTYFREWHICPFTRYHRKQWILPEQDKVLIGPLVIALIGTFTAAIVHLLYSQSLDAFLSRLVAITGATGSCYAYYTLRVPSEEIFYTGCQSLLPGLFGKYFTKLSSPGE